MPLQALYGPKEKFYRRKSRQDATLPFQVPHPYRMKILERCIGSSIVIPPIPAVNITPPPFPPLLVRVGTRGK